MVNSRRDPELYSESVKLRAVVQRPDCTVILNEVKDPVRLR